MNETQHDVTSGETTIDILAMIRMLLSKLHWLIAGGLVAAVIAYLVTVFLISPMYVSNVTMYVYNNNAASIQQNTVYSSDLAAAESLAQTYSLILKSNPVIDAVVAEVQSTTGKAVTRSQVNGMTSVGTLDESQVLSINVTSEDPLLSCYVATAFGKVAPAEIIRITKAGGVELVNTAEVATAPSSPNITKNTFLGLLVGIVLASGILIIRMMADTTIYLSEDIAKITNITILGEVPQFDIKQDQTKTWTMVQGGSISHGKKKESEN